VNRRRRAGLGSIVAGTVAVVLSFSASPASAGAQPPDSVGWWYELQTKTLPAPLPSPPVVPDGGLFVQQGPDGPMAYGAIRAHITGVRSATLLLVAASGSSTTTPPAAMQACATQSRWTQPQSEPGAWEDAPKYTSHCVPGIVATDGKSVAFYFETEFFAAGALDVAIVPTATATPFAIAFDKPDNQALQTVVAPPIPPTPTTVAATAPTANEATVAAPLPAQIAAPSTPSAPAPAAPSEIRPNVADNLLKVAGLGDPDRGERALALGGASLIVVGWWQLSTRAVPMPRLLGGLTPSTPAEESRIGGVGRFARSRTANPNLLR